jgi:hypothetical protein
MEMAAPGIAASSLVARCVVGGFAGLALAWAYFSVPLFWRQSPVENTAKYIIAEDSFKLESLTGIKAIFLELERTWTGSASLLRAGAILNLRLLEQTIARGDQERLDSLMSETDEMTRKSLIKAPAEPFLWTVLFWLENTRSGFNPAHLQYLKMSYSVGPNEGWVAAKRNRFSLAMFPVLTPDIIDNSMREFARLIGSNYYSVAADILEGPGWPIREKLMSGLRGVDEINRQTFAKLLYRRGFDLAVPGVERPDWRPWH